MSWLPAMQLRNVFLETGAMNLTHLSDSRSDHVTTFYLVFFQTFIANRDHPHFNGSIRQFELYA